MASLQYIEYTETLSTGIETHYHLDTWITPETSSSLYVPMIWTDGPKGALLVQRAWCCPVCGHIWARHFTVPAQIYLRDRPAPGWQFIASPCPDDGGGLILRDNLPHYQNIPRSILLRELLLELDLPLTLLGASI